MERVGASGSEGSEVSEGAGNEGSWARPSWTGSSGASTWSSTSAPALDLLRQVQERFRQDVPITFTLSSMKRWSATVNVGRLRRLRGGPPARQPRPTW